jgi:site-specific DNA-methyltransferase (adenine-specific)
MEPAYRDDIAGLALYHGEALAVLRDLADNAVDAVITDPPYSSGGAFRGDRMDAPSLKYKGSTMPRPDFEGDTRDQHAYGYWCALWLSECRRAAHVGAPVCIFTDWRQLAPTIDSIQAGGWVFRGVVAWDKTEAANHIGGRFTAQCEYVVWGSKGPMPLDRPMVGGRRQLPGVFRVGVNATEKQHIAGKPLGLMRQLVRISSPGGVVLDPFCGSGTTGAACWHEGLRFVGIESDPACVEVATRRLAKLAGQPRLLQDALPPRPRPLSLDEAEAAS